MNFRGTIGNRYEVVKYLGEGQSGRVFLACDRLDDGKQIALKLWEAPHPSLQDSLRTEFSTLTQLKHPNIGRVYDFGTTTKGEV